MCTSGCVIIVQCVQEHLPDTAVDDNSGIKYTQVLYCDSIKLTLLMIVCHFPDTTFSVL